MTVCMSVWSVTQSCLTRCNTMDCSPPDSSVRGISRARILEWVAISCSRGSSQPRDRTYVSCIDMWILYHCATWEALIRWLHGDKCPRFSTWRLRVICENSRTNFKQQICECFAWSNWFVTRGQHAFNKHKLYWQDCIFFGIWFAGLVVRLINECCV